jgi:hypothetical protein
LRRGRGHSKTGDLARKAFLNPEPVPSALRPASIAFCHGDDPSWV